MDKNPRSLTDLVTRIGDHGPSHYRPNLQKLIDTIAKDLEREEFRQELAAALLAVVPKMPNKSFVYATLVAHVSQTQVDFAEHLFAQLLEALQAHLASNEVLQASNVLCFFAETVNAGLMNSFTFISLLMEMLTASEKDEENFEALTKLVVKAALYVKAHLVEKYEMEYANLMEDLKKNVDKFVKSGRTFESGSLLLLLDPLADATVKSTFRLAADDCKDFVKSVKPIRQNFKLTFAINGPRHPLSTLPELGIFEKELSDIRQQSRQGILNEFLVKEYIRDNFIAFSQNIVLFIEKMFAVNLGGHETVKNFAFVDLCYSALLHPSKFQTNQTFAIIVEMLIKYFNFEVFFEDSLAKFSKLLATGIEQLSVEQLQTIIDNLALVNYLTSKNFSLTLPSRDLPEKAPYVDFLQAYKTLKQSLANQTTPINRADLTK